MSAKKWRWAKDWRSRAGEELGDISGCGSREGIRQALGQTYPKVADNVIRNRTGTTVAVQGADQGLVTRRDAAAYKSRPGRDRRNSGPYEYRTRNPRGSVRYGQWSGCGLTSRAKLSGLDSGGEYLARLLLTVFGGMTTQRCRPPGRVSYYMLEARKGDPGDGSAAEKITTRAEELPEDALPHVSFGTRADWHIPGSFSLALGGRPAVPAKWSRRLRVILPIRGSRLARRLRKDR